VKGSTSEWIIRRAVGATCVTTLCGLLSVATLLASCGSVAGQSATTDKLPRSTTTTTVAVDELLAGKIVGIDPGHNGLNYTDPSFLNHQIFNGKESEDCDTTGTETASGYTEARFNFNVAMFLKSDLISEGARVVLTRSTNHGVGPCVTTRAEILNRAHVNVAIDIHADYGPSNGRGFAILEPIADGPNDAVISSSIRFGAEVRSEFLAVTGMPLSTYDGIKGIKFRDDLAGLNLTTVPKVLIECGNMNNATDAARLVTRGFQELAAKALAAAITDFLR
jgi:N-acetylmuramoyl-L-alanine amidase